MLDDRIFKELLEAAPDGIVIVDAAGRIVLVNPQAEHMFGCAQSELVGRPVEVIVPARLRSVHNLHRSTFLNDARPRPMGAGLTLAVGSRSTGQASFWCCRLGLFDQQRDLDRHRERPRKHLPGKRRLRRQAEHDIAVFTELVLAPRADTTVLEPHVHGEQ